MLLGTGYYQLLPISGSYWCYLKLSPTVFHNWNDKWIELHENSYFNYTAVTLKKGKSVLENTKALRLAFLTRNFLQVSQANLSFNLAQGEEQISGPWIHTKGWSLSFKSALGQIKYITFHLFSWCLGTVTSFLSTDSDSNFLAFHASEIIMSYSLSMKVWIQSTEALSDHGGTIEPKSDGRVERPGN